ncbi:hypothetical protein [Castellaniella defragrans]|uniref:DUF945 domain-containing protein n=1 Tax=Castellaniella defragrans TaxID=75697 RepID=A0A7W9TMS6_CASDE|nr:hypothetical protein [Castellaniella defragrans]KAB0606028.1 hypothetical protein F7Q88_14650 [Castellaniella defragrans]MBB6083429.1 hypothetical protein [Castellaniella defragrans]
MDKQKKILVIGGLAALVLIGGWLAVSHVATSRAEDKLYAFLDRYQLRDAVHWQSLSASPFGTATLKGITIRLGEGQNAEKGAIERIHLSDLEDSEDRKSARVEVTGIAGGDGRSLLNRTSLIQAAGRADLPPFSLTMDWRLDRKDDTGALHFSLEQPKAFDGKFDLELSRVRDLLRLADRLAHGGGDDFQELAGGFGFLGPLGALAVVSQKIQQMEVRAVRASIRDEGYGERSRALAKRHDFDAAPGEGSADVQRERWFKEKIDAGRAQCKKDPEAAFGGAPLSRDDCLALLDFVTGESAKLTVKMEPARPVSLEQLLEGGSSRDPYRSIRLLEMRLDN